MMRNLLMPREPDQGTRIDKVPILDYYDPTENKSRHMWKKAFMGVIGRKRIQRSFKKANIADLVPKMRAIEILKELNKVKVMK